MQALQQAIKTIGIQVDRVKQEDLGYASADDTRRDRFRKSSGRHDKGDISVLDAFRRRCIPAGSRVNIDSVEGHVRTVDCIGRDNVVV